MSTNISHHPTIVTHHRDQPSWPKNVGDRQKSAVALPQQVGHVYKHSHHTTLPQVWSPTYENRSEHVFQRGHTLSEWSPVSREMFAPVIKSPLTKGGDFFMHAEHEKFAEHNLFTIIDEKIALQLFGRKKFAPTTTIFWTGAIFSRGE